MSHLVRFTFVGSSYRDVYVDMTHEQLARIMKEGQPVPAKDRKGNSIDILPHNVLFLVWEPRDAS